MKQNVLVEIKLSIFGNIHCIPWQMQCIQIALAAAKGFQPPINQLSEYRKTGTFKLLTCTVPMSLPKRTVLYFCSKTSTIYDVNILWRTQRRLKFESGSKRVNGSSNLLLHNAKSISSQNSCLCTCTYPNISSTFNSNRRSQVLFR